MVDDIIAQTPFTGIKKTYRTTLILSLNEYPNPLLKGCYSLIEMIDIDDLILSIYDFLDRFIHSFLITNMQFTNNEVSWDGRDEPDKEIAFDI